MFIIKSILQGFLTLFLVSLLIFVAYRLMPGDEVEAYSGLTNNTKTWKEVESYRNNYENTAQELHLDLPIFYFDISKYAYDERFFKTTFIDDKSFLRTVFEKKYEPKTAFDLLNYERIYQKYFYHIKEKKVDSTLNIESISSSFLTISSNLQEKKPFLTSFLSEEKKQLDSFYKNETPFERLEIPLSDVKYFSWLPHFYFNGRDCQYHRWLQKIAVGDFGKSYYSKRLVFEEIRDAIRWSLLLNLVALLLIFLVGIPLGLKAAEKYGQHFDKILMRFNFISDAIPPFWVATLVLIFLTTSHYHIKIFPSAGLGEFPIGASFGEKLWIALPHFIAPVLCILFTSISLIIRQMRSSAIQIFQQDFIRTARAKGLSTKEILTKHVFQNAIFPIITLVGIMLPHLIIGSILIENTFNISGLGKTLVDSMARKDFPIMIAIVLIIACATLFTTFITDILYKFFNPLY